ncbi:MAG: rod-binding protein [Verrucomicrobiales bacterium]|nr:rod-binding protein [Verrucomicrobiales bacterium]
METSALSFPVNRGPAVPLDQLQRNPRLSEREKVEEAARQFEAVLLRQILTEARKTIIKSDDGSESSSTEIYQDMINQQLADAISQSGSFGLAQSLEGQLTRQTLQPAEPSISDPRAVSAEEHDSSL